ncbi:protein of unknown function [Burkholderia multivorans]
MMKFRTFINISERGSPSHSLALEGVFSIQ